MFFHSSMVKPLILHVKKFRKFAFDTDNVRFFKKTFIFYGVG